MVYVDDGAAPNPEEAELLPKFLDEEFLRSSVIDLREATEAYFIDGQSGADTIYGSNYDDYIIGSWDLENSAEQTWWFDVDNDGNDTIYGGAGNDAIHGWGDNDYVDGGVGNDIITGGDGNDTLIGGDGGDALVGGHDDDVLNGGAGIDVAIYTDATGGLTVDLNLGTAVSLDGSDTLISVENIFGSTYGDLIRGNGSANFLSGETGDDTIYGGSGADFLIGGAGNDILNGGSGADTITGGVGNDVYNVDNVADKVTEDVSGGTDRVHSSITYTLGANVENLTLTGTAAINGAGNGHANVLTGNSAANTLSGGSGNDVLNGSAGADTLNGGTGGDRLYGGSGKDVLTGGSGGDSFYFDSALSSLTNVDRITDFSVIDDTIRLDDDVFTAAGVVGGLAVGAFVAGTAAKDASDRIIYDSATGNIYYDADGNGAGAQVLFAQVSPSLALTNLDFVVVA